MASVQDKTDLATKVSALIRAKFGGDWRRAFWHYDGDHDGGIDRAELTDLLRDAGVGNYFTRGAWASGVTAEMDADGDGRITWPEFETVFTGQSSPALDRPTAGTC